MIRINNSNPIITFHCSIVIANFQTDTNTEFHKVLVAEAKRLWELEVGQSKLTTIQAGILMNILYDLSSLDKIGVPYQFQAIGMAKEINLFTEVNVNS
jgi:hypothetical protein